MKEGREGGRGKVISYKIGDFIKIMCEMVL